MQIMQIRWEPCAGRAAYFYRGPRVHVQLANHCNMWLLACHLNILGYELTLYRFTQLIALYRPM